MNAVTGPAETGVGP